MTAEIPIYDPKLLNKFNLGERYETLKEDESLCVRPLYMSDYNRGFLELLGELTEVGNVSEEQFQGLSFHIQSLFFIHLKHIYLDHRTV